MPSQTFLNLPEKKRERITQLAIAEFAAADYDKASITNIVKQAKIAKGSFYQYFEDKKDLYLHLVDSATQERMEFIEAAREAAGVDEPSRDFFETLRWLFRVSTQFSFEHPLLNQIINRAAYGDCPFRHEVLVRSQRGGHEYIKNLVEKGIANGDLLPTLDPDMAVFVITTTGQNLRFFVPEKLGLNTEDLTQTADISIDTEALERIYDDLIQIFNRGMSKL